MMLIYTWCVNVIYIFSHVNVAFFRDNKEHVFIDSLHPCRIHLVIYL